VVDILDEYRRQGGTLFFSSHVLHDVERIADRFGLIHHGELLTIRSPQELPPVRPTATCCAIGATPPSRAVARCGRVFTLATRVLPTCRL
jgi:ABC-2 type transport system ATP-binding protein